MEEAIKQRRRLGHAVLRYTSSPCVALRHHAVGQLLIKQIRGHDMPDNLTMSSGVRRAQSFVESHSGATLPAKNTHEVGEMVD